MKEVDCMHVAEDSIKKIKEGAFLTVKSGNVLNTMAIGWATFGVVWSKPIMMVAVRLSRHTFGIIEAAKDFTVTIPAGDMRKEIAYCGSKSGRNVDKFKMCNLETMDGRHVTSPIIKTKGRNYECRIIYKSAMNPAHFDKDYESSLYPKNDYHTFILARCWPATKLNDIHKASLARLNIMPDLRGEHCRVLDNACCR